MLKKWVPLDNGMEMLCRPVPPHIQQQARLKLPAPPYPKTEVKSVAGSSERLPALPGTEEYDEYHAAVQRHQTICQIAINDFSLDYGCMLWRAKGSDSEGIGTPPKDWEVPDILIDRELIGVGGVLTVRERRVLYIKSELIQTDADMEAVDSVLYPVKPVTKEELVAALDPFASDGKVDLMTLLRGLGRV